MKIWLTYMTFPILEITHLNVGYLIYKMWVFQDSRNHCFINKKKVWEAELKNCIDLYLLWLSSLVRKIFLYNPHLASWAWLRPGFVQKTQQLPLLSLTTFLSLTPHVKLTGVGALVSNNCKYSTHSPLCNHNSFESRVITVTAPIKLLIVVIYRPPWQILGTFLEELNGLLSSFVEDGTPLLVFGDFNIHQHKPYATDFHSLLASFELKLLTTTNTNKSGSQLDLIYNCVADNILVKPLHTSDNYSIISNYSIVSSCYLRATNTSTSFL